MFNFIKRAIRLNFGVDKEYYRFIDDMFGFVPSNIELYKVALIHKSASQTVGGHHINNERLEYLGDAVIESVTSDYLFIAYPDRDEGFLTQMRSKIVSRQSLNEMAVFIGLDKYLICKSGAMLQQKHLFGDAFEAMMGAIYLDKGYDFVNRLLINDIFARYLSIEELSYSENDFKSRLIEWCQKNRHSLEFRTRKEIDRKNSSQIFFTTVVIDGIEMGHGAADSKKSSEQKAAESLCREMSDEECAKLLDRIDRMLQRTDNEGAAKSEQKKKAPKPAEEPASESASAEGESSAAAVDAAEHKPSEHKKRRGRRKKSETATAVEGVGTEVAEAPAESAEQPEKKRRGRRKKSETAVESGAETVAAEQPEKKRRGRRKKSETAPETADAAAADAAETIAEPAEKKRRGRRKKSEQQPEGGDAAATSSGETAEQTHSEHRKRRGRRKKSETAAAEASAETPSVPEAAAE